FENWTVDTALTLDFWTISNTVPLGYPSVMKETGAPIVNNAVRIETVGQGLYTTRAGVIESGFPYTDSPSALTGFIRYDIKPGDTGIISIHFWKNGLNWFGGNWMAVYGVQSSLVPFTIPFILIAKPDSAYISISTNKSYVDTAQAGSYLVVDELMLTGATQQIPNGSLDNWSPTYMDNPADWVYHGTVSKTTDKHTGNYAMKMETVKYTEHAQSAAYFPYTVRKDTVTSVTGYYKNYSTANYAGTIEVKLMQNGIALSNDFLQINLNQSAYTYFEIPIDTGIIADSLIIVATTSIDSGTELFIDDLKFKQTPVNIKRIPSISHSMYPNPVHETLNIRLDGAKYRSATVRVYDINGKLALQNDYNLVG
ncbi:MAG: T9SS type A sorting domain-containing protein, partial [Taibaiella sp.]|nr:T9SS type A sorting domain-containing protein [Taibaiella sp.]